MMARIFTLFLAGGAGAVARYSLAGLVQRLAGETFPWGTFLVNVLGSFLFGLVWILASERDLLSMEARIIILTGFMGSFTTFSTFMFESGQLLERSQPWLAVANIVGQAVCGLIFLFLGFAAGRHL